ncbi:rCG21469 [Rattus norvegicus]|uniref:RCG21469 n=1 Tax=Rattus norvegicus TaxID=10116 RepID=A6J115_RAT|nr:rCG21469 [Rattus norvegicus]
MEAGVTVSCHFPREAGIKTYERSPQDSKHVTQTVRTAMYTPHPISEPPIASS